MKDFYKDCSRPDGLSSRCKECDKRKASSYFKTSDGKATKKRYRQSTKGRIAKQKDDKKYRESENGRKHIYANIARYNQTDKGRITKQQSARRRRHRVRNVDMQLSNADIQLIYERFNNRCFNCDAQERLEIDHHYPLIDEFGLCISNAVLLCRSCNAKKHTKHPEDFYTSRQFKQLVKVLAL